MIVQHHNKQKINKEQTNFYKQEYNQLQAQSNSQKEPKQNAIQAVKEYICFAQLQEKQTTIKQLNQKLKEKEEQIKKIQNKHRQDLLIQDQKILEEKGKIIKQMQSREKKIGEQVKYIKQAEMKRDKSFKQIRLLFIESNYAIQNNKQQILDKIGQSRHKNEQNLTSKKKIIQLLSEITSLKHNLQLAENKNKELEDKLENNEKQVFDIKTQEIKRQQEYRNKNTQLQHEYFSLKQSLERQVQKLRQNNKKQVDKFERQIKVFQDYKSKNKEQFNEIIKSQKELKSKLQKLIKQKQALQNIQKQQALKINQLTKDEILLNNLLQQKKLQQQQIKRLNLDLIRKEQMITLSKNTYDEKLKGLEISYNSFKKQQKDIYERQKRDIEHQHFKIINQLNQNIIDINKDKENSRKAQIQAQETLKTQKQSFKSKINILEQQIKNYKNFLQQFRTILHAEARISNETEDPEQILNHLNILIKNLKDTATASKLQEQKAKQTTSSLNQLCEFNKTMLAKLIQNVKNIQNYKKMKEQPDNANHLGFIINRLADNIKSLVEQKQNIINSKVQIIYTTENQNKSLNKELNITKLILAQLNKKQNSLQIQNRTLKLNAESKNIELEKIKYKKQELDPSIDLQIKEMKQQLLKSKNQSQQQKRINKQLKIQIKMLQNKNQSDQSIRKINQLSKNIQSLNQELKIQKELNRTLNKKIQQQKERNKTLQLSGNLQNKELQKFKEEMKQKELKLKQSFDRSLLEISKTLEEVSGNELQNKQTNGILQFIRKNGCSSSNSNTSFTVSEILQKLPKQRSFLVDECCKFLGAKFISSKLSFKYDQNFRNFSFYIPTPLNKFLFAVILKTKKNVVFGMISTFIGRDSKAFAFNLNTRKIMNKSIRTKLSSTSYQSNMLKFGNDEIVIKNNSNLEVRVNTMILGERYFEFTKDDLVGKEQTGDKIQLESFQIHKITAIV